MSRCLTLLLALAFAFLHANPLPANERGLSKLAHELRKSLPQGWKLHTSKQHWILQREKPVPFYNGINLQGFDSEEKFQEYVKENSIHWDYLIVLRFGDRVSPMQYETWEAQNRRASEHYERLARGVRDITHKFDQYLPSNEEEKQRVAAFQAEVAKIRNKALPDYFNDRYSVYLETTQNWSLSMSDDEIAKECADVESLALKGFRKYR